MAGAWPEGGASGEAQKGLRRRETATYRQVFSAIQRGFPPRRCRNELFPSREQRNMRTAEIALDEVCLVDVPPRTCLSSPPLNAIGQPMLSFTMRVDCFVLCT